MAPPRAAARTRLRRQRLLAGPVGKVLFGLSWPLSLGMFSIIAFNIVDTLYIGRLGGGPLAAIGYCFPVIFSMSAIAIGLGNGATSVVSRSLGRRDMDRARIRSTDTVVLTAMLSVALILLMFLFDDMIFDALGAPQELRPYIHQYMNVWFVGLPFLVLPIVLNGLIRSTGDAIFPSVMMVIAAGINALISPFLIFGIWGAPELGMAGAAWATVAARGTLVVAGFIHLHRQDLISFRNYDLSVLPNSFAEVMRFGAPAFLAQFVSPFSSAIAVRLLSGSGGDAVAAYTIATRIESLMLVPMFAIGAGISPFTGQNVGAGRPERLKAAQLRALSFALGWGLVAALLLGVFGHFIAGFFAKEAEIIRLASRFLALIGLGIWGAGFLQVAVGVANPLGHPNLGMGLSIFRHLILFAGGSTLLVVGFGIDPTKIILVVGPLAYGIAGITSAIVTRLLITRSVRARDHSEAARTAPSAS